MTNLAPKYNHRKTEKGRYDFWLKQGLFKAANDPKKKPYTIILPPPNITGKLHLGHAWDTTIQDTLIRFKRMQGYDTLYLPGMDHAGIATQAKIEAKLKAQGKTRRQIGRKAFLKETWSWKDEYASIIRQQWAKLGLSLDYSRERFTLDAGASKAIRKAFTQLYHEGLIYRGKYMINWDPELQTAISDMEIIHQDDPGKLYYIKYPLADNSGFITIATTRPETMLGDTAIAFAPNDKRYQHLLGKKAILPLTKRRLPIISDYAIDTQYGTGMEKITPAHDFTDFEIGKRHHLKQINLMNDDGSMNENAGKYNGLDRFACRKAIIKDLKAQGYLIKTEKITHSVGHSERSGAILEPRLSRQWFLKMKPLAEKALALQKSSNKIDFIPERFNDTYKQWLDNIHDWVLSRQLWWGHQIPAWYNKKSHEIYVGEDAPKDIENWQQDPDVLDTWFSSSLWPFLTLGWPDKTKDYQRYFPTNTLVTGYDILPFWVLRMICQSLHFTGKKPFKRIIFHGLIRDEQGRKMSKSLGNGIDPMDIIDQYGADALRWFLLNGTTPGQDTRFDSKKLAASWNFINKLWNAARFIIMNLPENFKMPIAPNAKDFDLADQWIFAKLNQTISHTIKMFDEYQFGEAERGLTNFIRNDFCDWYIEISKIALNGTNEQLKAQKQANLAYLLDQILRLLHPIIPFVTEELWQALPHQAKSIMLMPYPEPKDGYNNNLALKRMELLISLITAIRQTRQKLQLPLSKPIAIKIQLKASTDLAWLSKNKELFSHFTKPKSLEIGTNITAPKESKSIILPQAEIYLPLSDLIDLEKEKAQLEQKAQKLRKEIARLDTKLSNTNFINKAPKAIIAKEKNKRQMYQTELTGTKKRLNTINASKLK